LFTEHTHLLAVVADLTRKLAEHEWREKLVKGYLVTMRDGHECRLGPDKTRAELYAAQNHALVEPLFVSRPRKTPP
jgi:hypothetical protein